jgi:carbon storage regulator CsrA
MLVLSRKPTEEIVFPDLGITVRVVEVRGNYVRLAFDAPAEVSIARAELLGRREGAANARRMASSRKRMAGRGTTRGPRDGTNPPLGALR